VTGPKRPALTNVAIAASAATAMIAIRSRIY
jgi:hypothetical protein